ncbi:MAG: cofactor-independent phosphoglycerate mutase [Planctomycetes bacterium]|nr:cofactor-independent phosphoglycerate mutase [Planctomycetota bacterium]
MKYCIVVPDGAADFAVRRLGGKTPLEAARTPNLDRAAQEGLLGIARHVPPRMPPGSSVAIMSVVGYDPQEYFTGRGPLEAADLGIEMGPDDWAVRCNLVTTAEGRLADFTAGHISTGEAEVLLAALNDELGNEETSFHLGTSYRHVVLYTGAQDIDAETTPPHQVVGQPIEDHYPTGPGGEYLLDLMKRSREALQSHEVNQVRVDLGRNPANMIWLWSPGRKPSMESFADRFGLRGAVISAVNLVKGIGRIIGWDVIDVPGATGYTDTDYAAKGRYGISALKDYGVLLIHIEAPDEASHDRDVKAKIRAIEQIDKAIVGPLMAHAEQEGDLRLLICPDHVTSVEDGKHKRDPVPFAIWGQGVLASANVPFTEGHAAATEVQIDDGYELIGELIGRRPKR